MDLIVRFLGWMLSRLLPDPRGRHRLGVEQPSPQLLALPPTVLVDLIDGSASPLIRPYLLTPDERRLQRERRRALYLATLGIDTGPNHIHGIRVGATR